MAKLKMAEFKMSASFQVKWQWMSLNQGLQISEIAAIESSLSQNEWVKFFESKMAEFKMAGTNQVESEWMSEVCFEEMS